jgi:hypothetical protein
VGAALGVVLAGAAVFVMRLSGSRPEVHEPAHPSAEAVATSSADAPAPAPEKLIAGQSLDTLPPDQPGVVERARLSGPTPAGKSAAVDRMVHDMEAMRAEQNGPAAKVTLTEEKDKDRVAAIANQVSLDDHGSPSDQAPQESDFDKATTQAQLAHAAQLVGTCRKAGNDTGPGRALVTLSSSGTPQSVTIQGKLSGTPVGECVAAQFRNVRIPPFTGKPVTVAKAFVITDGS